MNYFAICPFADKEPKNPYDLKGREKVNFLQYLILREGLEIEEINTGEWHWIANCCSPNDAKCALVQALHTIRWQCRFMSQEIFDIFDGIAEEMREVILS